MKKFDFGKEYTPNPNSSKRKMGEFSGEEFREEYLEKWISSKEIIELSMDNILNNIHAAYIFESFGKIIKKYSKEEFNKYIILNSKTIKGQFFDNKIKRLILL